MDGSKTTPHEARPTITTWDENPPSEEGRADEDAGLRSAAGRNDAGSRYVTAVITEFKTQDCHHRTLFGAPIRRVILLRKKGHLKVSQEFLPGARFVLDLWRRNDHGTLQWRCFVCEAVRPGETAQRVPQVIPGARVLLVTKGAAESKIFLAWIYSLAREGVDVLRLPREAFEAAHFRLKGSRAVRLDPRTLSGDF